ncbi:hypothetical protein C0Q44_18500 [Paenibacillus sp. PCH8]|uniref:hypothetical protein n=1 Tax=Paenibacillus sp. PCH8 TaxID=2066524 RepID=UPI000CF91D73|nr:hypothetical protein [Paenibacillus sp. PCH8]PQP81686.1 hypothetical protein C0Q44_18500 [Paenibacillus sp. PCH8]
MSANEEHEVLLSNQPAHLWRRRKLELMQWTERDKHTVSPKRTVLWKGVEVDTELVKALSILQKAGMTTEFSCAGVSPLDEPVDHSLYAYVTLVQSEVADQFVRYALNRMRNRLLVTLEAERGCYDLSSFFIGHNRSFCWWMEHCASQFTNRNGSSEKSVV